MSERHDPSQARSIWPPSVGYFRMSLVRKGWAVPCMISIVNGQWQATVDGKELPPDADPALAERVSDIWHSGHFIDRSEYLWRLAIKEHSERSDPDHPSLHPMKPISLNRLKPL